MSPPFQIEPAPLGFDLVFDLMIKYVMNTPTKLQLILSDGLHFLPLA